jgi:UDP-N-acetylmuramyl pentapeptide synthase
MSEALRELGLHIAMRRGDDVVSHAVAHGELTLEVVAGRIVRVDAIENLMRQPHDKKVILIGGLMELGTESIAEHAEIITLLQTNPWHLVILVGGDFSHVAHAYLYFPNAAAAAEWLVKHPLTEAMVLVKGSRSMQMEMVLQAL